MTEPEQAKTTSKLLNNLKAAIANGTVEQVRRNLATLHPAEIASLLESTPSPERELIWELVSPEDEGDVLLHVNDNVRLGLIKAMDPEQLVAATEDMDLDDLADIIDDLPQAVTRQVIRSMSDQERVRLKAVLAYPENSAGGLMNPDMVTIRPDVTLDVVLRYLRLRDELPQHSDSLVVVDRYGRYAGLVYITDLLLKDPDTTVDKIMDASAEPINASMPAPKVAQLFENRDLISAVVVNNENVVLGRITIDDVVDVIREEADHSLMRMAGLDTEEDMFAPVLPAFRRRAMWLGVNLLTAFLASSVVGAFQATIQHVVVLAVLMPIVASMGGIAGTQVLTLMIRSLALGQVGRSNFRKLLIKEVSIGLLNGLAWAVVLIISSYIVFDNLVISLTVGLAMLTNLFIAACAGMGVPILLRRMKVDPALAGPVILTTFTDVIGFFSLLGIGTLLLF